MSNDLKDRAIAPAFATAGKVVTATRGHKPELLAPAGSIESFFAAMDYGADAVYVSLLQRGAPDNAVNLTLDELDTVVGHAHRLKRKVYVANNAIIRQSQWAETIKAMGYCEEIGVDAVVLQDFGLMRAIREQFPRLKWHAAAEMLVHNPQGARWAERNGFARVALAWGLPLEDIRNIQRNVELELEVLIHGNLTGGVSPRPPFVTTDEQSMIANAPDARPGDNFTERDLFAMPEVHRLAEIGVRSVKVAGLYKSPLYVAAVIDLYRKIVDGEGEKFRAAREFERHGRLGDKRERESASRFRARHTNKLDKRKWTGRIKRAATGSDELRRVPPNAIERLYPTSVPHTTDKARLPVHLDVALKVNPGGETLSELGMPGLIEIVGRIYTIEIRREYPCKLLFADNQPMNEERLREFFERLGRTRFELRTFGGLVPAGVFIPAAEINEARRQFFNELEEAFENARRTALDEAARAITAPPMEADETVKAPATKFSALVDQARYIKALPLEFLDAVTLDVTCGPIDEILDAWSDYGPKLQIRVPAVVRRMDVPGVQARLRTLFEKGARRFQVGGMGGFEIIAEAVGIADEREADTGMVVKRPRELNPRSGLAIYEPTLPDFERAGIEISTDWSCYAMSGETVRCWLEQGASRVTLNLEDARGNLSEVLREFAGVSDVIVYRDASPATPETFVYPDTLDHGLGGQPFQPADKRGRDADRYLPGDRWRRRIIPGEPAFSWSHNLRQLEEMGAHAFRLDFINRNYDAEQIQEICEQVMNAQPIESTHQGNWQA